MATTYSSEERAQRERFDTFYLKSQSPVLLTIERSVCGCDYGGNSWTTRTEAQRIASRLELRPGKRLLDLGAGAGWPALYMAKTSGCDVVLVDLPLSGLRIAAERAGIDGIADHVSATVADAAALPLADESFDAISHSDLLCCLRHKRGVLAACRAAIRRHGHMVFTVISVASGLPAKQHGRAVANGPEFIETDTDYPKLLAETGWVLTGREDVTKAYAASCRRQLEADEAHKDELASVIGANELDERLASWRPKLSALTDNLLQRHLFVASPNLE